MSAIKLHVGYVGKTRDGKRVDIVKYRNSPGYPWLGSNHETYTECGSVCHIGVHDRDIIAPWVDAPEPIEWVKITVKDSGKMWSYFPAAPAPDYNNGEWWGWNGGECPVHPETVVEAVYNDGNHSDMREIKTQAARFFCWGTPSSMIAFRVVTPYVEPPKPRECWMAERDGKMIEVHCHVSDAIHFREVLE